jgi:hypothetical protein
MVGLPRFRADASQHTPLFMLGSGARVASDCFWQHWPAALGRQCSATTGCFRVPYLERLVCDSELGAGAVMSRPRVVKRVQQLQPFTIVVMVEFVSAKPGGG